MPRDRRPLIRTVNVAADARAAVAGNTATVALAQFAAAVANPTSTRPSAAGLSLFLLRQYQLVINPEKPPARIERTVRKKHLKR